MYKFKIKYLLQVLTFFVQLCTYTCRGLLWYQRNSHIFFSIFPLAISFTCDYNPQSTIDSNSNAQTLYRAIIFTSNQLVQQVLAEYNIHEQHKRGNFTRTYRLSCLDYFLCGSFGGPFPICHTNGICAQSITHHVQTTQQQQYYSISQTHAIGTCQQPFPGTSPCHSTYHTNNCHSKRSLAWCWNNCHA